MAIRILIAVENSFVAFTLHHVCTSIGEIEIIDNICNLSIGISKFKPNIAVIDFSSYTKSTDYVLSLINEVDKSIKVILTSLPDDVSSVNRFIKAGIHGIICKDENPMQLVEAINAVTENKTWISPSKLDFYTKVLFEPTIDIDDVFLNKDQIEVLTLLSKGMTSDEISKQLYVSPRGVNYLIEQAIRRLNAHNRIEAVALALRKSII